MLSLKHGEYLVRLARQAVENYFITGSELPIPSDAPSELMEKRGVFTTIYRISSGETSVGIAKELRGCIGFPLPIKPLLKATIESALSAAFEDPRFPPLKEKELDGVIFEVSALTQPKLIQGTPEEIMKNIKIGRDGLIIQKGFMSGLLLPQVPVEYDWDVETFLGQACMKAGLPPDAWVMRNAKIYTFQAEIFTEIQPKGKVIRLMIEKWKSEK
ncbi:MAG: TIGR00296 family protein [Thermoprotei archaeon]